MIHYYMSRLFIFNCEKRMKTTKNCRSRKFYLSLSVAALILLFCVSGQASADDKYWSTSSGNWSDPANWSSYDPLEPYNPGGLPADGDNVYLWSYSPDPLYVYYDNPSTDNVYSHIGIDSNADGNMVLSMELIGGPALRSLGMSVGETPGYYGHVEHSTGLNRVQGDLVLGESSGSDGSYHMQGDWPASPSLAVGNLILGDEGRGEFTQQGAASTVTVNGDLEIGKTAFSSGYYNLNGGSLTVIGDINGGHGTSTLRLNGGTLSVGGDIGVGFFVVGDAEHDTGAYEHAYGALSATSLIVGDKGQGAFTQKAADSAQAPSTSVSNLYVGNQGGSFGEYFLEGGTLEADETTIGWAGHGEFTQTGGTHNVNDLDLAKYGSSHGAYNLDGGTLNADFITGGAGASTLSINGGEFEYSVNYIEVDRLILGEDEGEAGRYVQDYGNVEANSIDVGRAGSGEYIHNSGTVNAGAITLGYYVSGSGVYALEDGGALEGNSLSVGYAGAGEFIQNGGAHTISNSFYMAYLEGSSGLYSLNGGTLNVGDIHLGYGGDATFEINDGMLNMGGNFVNGDGTGTLVVNSFYTLPDGLDVDNLILARDPGTSVEQFQSGGTTYVRDTMTIGEWGNAQYSIYGGSLEAGRVVNNDRFFQGVSGIVRADLENYGTFDNSGGWYTGQIDNYGYMSGYGTYSGEGGINNYANMVAGGGPMRLDGQDLNNYGGLVLGQEVVGDMYPNAGGGSYNPAIITGTGALNNMGGVISGQGSIRSSFYNAGTLAVEDGGIHVMQDFANDGLIQLAGYSSVLSGGEIANNGKIEGCGTVANDVINEGVIEAREGTLTLSGGISNESGGTIMSGHGTQVLVLQGLDQNRGLIALNRGTFDNNGNAMTNAAEGRITGQGVLNTGGLSNEGGIVLAGGTTTVNGDTINRSGGELEVAHGHALFNGHVENEAGSTFKTTEAEVTFAGGFLNSGHYYSDPSAQHFTNLTVNPTGYLTAGKGDEFYISGDFINNSSMNEEWNTVEAFLAFVDGGGEHLLSVAGEDYGAGIVGYNDNFAWGSLDISGGDDILLQDAGLSPADDTDFASGAFYVETLLGAEIFEGMIMNIIGQEGLNVYYRAMASGNEYLYGMDYNLSGGGMLIAVQSEVPIPAAFWLFGSGLAFLIGLRRRN